MSKLPLASDSKKKSDEATINLIIPCIEESITNANYSCYVPFEYLKSTGVRDILKKAGYTVITETNREGCAKICWD